MDSLLIISLLYEVSGKKEFQNGLIDLIFKEARNNEEAGENKYIQIPNSVTSIGRCAFEDCYSLTSIIIPKSVTSIGHSAFYNCNSLTSIIIPEIFKSRINEIFKDVDLSSIKITYI